MRDPYLYEDVDVLKNKLGIKDAEKLEDAEAAITLSNLLDVEEFGVGEFNIKKLKDIHKHIFGDIYEWAGEFRKVNIEKSEKVLYGLSVQYSPYESIEKDAKNAIDKFNRIEWKELNLDEIAEKLSKCTAELWKVHCFREGNTRTTITFAETFAKSKGITIDKELLKDNSKYVRDSLVLSSIGQYSEYNHLIKIIKDSISIKKDINIDKIKDGELKKERYKSLPKKRIKKRGIER
ncbi:Fic/DOC family protein [Clostridium neonatale]|jgi:cell filamentation protein|uniref:Fic/DOC family protein n=1 Tax=Clostridium neonatale TaxID=137838 RepID=UPI00374F7A16